MQDVCKYYTILYKACEPPYNLVSSVGPETNGPQILGDDSVAISSRLTTLPSLSDFFPLLVFPVFQDG